MPSRMLVMGDNHGDCESLQRVLDDIEGESLDLAVHVGDFTRAWRRDRAHGIEQLQAVDPLLEQLDDRTEHGLLWVWGNQDYFGDLDYDLDVGREIPDGNYLTVDGQRFTNDPSLVGQDDILVTHKEKWSLVDHFEGKAHFCGNTHVGRWMDRRLNAAFLQVTDPETDSTTYGGYFVVDFAETPPFAVELRSIGALERRSCGIHGERGVQFVPEGQDCLYCWDETALMREFAASAFYGLARVEGRDAIADTDLVRYAASLWEDPPAGFRRALRSYLETLDSDRYAPLTHDDSGHLVVADESYAY